MRGRVLLKIINKKDRYTELQSTENRAGDESQMPYIHLCITHKENNIPNSLEMF